MTVAVLKKLQSTLQGRRFEDIENTRENVAAPLQVILKQDIHKPF
jgi:hypothetical protein